jgi:hypothetical protein
MHATEFNTQQSYSTTHVELLATLTFSEITWKVYLKKD